MADDTTPRHPNDRPQERTWTVPTTVITDQGEEVPNLQGAEYALQEAATILMRMGGVISIGAKRVKLEAQGRFGERYETEILAFRHVSHPVATPKVAVAAAAPPEASAE